MDKQVSKFPEKLAACDKSGSISYQNLDSLSNQFGRLLRKNAGIEVDKIAAILMNRSIPMLVSITSLWKAGGGYVPIDPSWPVERQVNLIKSSGAGVVITTRNIMSEELIEKLGNDVQILFYEEETEKFKFESSQSLDRSYVSTSGISCVFFTSGSTGQPKGAAVEHGGMLNHLLAKIDVLEMEEGCRISQNSSQCFDISVWQFFSPIIVGGTTYIYEKDVIGYPKKFIEQLEKDKITVVEVVPSYLTEMLSIINIEGNKLENLKYIMLTGEPITPELVGKWFEVFHHIPMINAYGATETSDDITHFKMVRPLKGKNVPVGYPIRNSRIYIVDENMNRCPIGGLGEICVSGIAVGRGYINNPEKTKENFLKNKFIDIEERFYRMGDIGRWTCDGLVECMGRVDEQVKIRGHRIELGEIRSHILRENDIKDVVVIDYRANDQTELVAFLISESLLSQEVIEKGLRKRLPSYMIPSQYVLLEHFPLNSNGKIDKKELYKKIEAIKSDDLAYVEPETKIEESLQEIWQKILGRPKVGVLDNFYSIGGNSIKAASIVYNIKSLLNIDVTLRQIFEQPNIRDLAKLLEQSNPFTEVKFSPVPEMSSYPTSSSQKRMWLDWMMDPGSSKETMQFAYKLEGEINSNILEKSLKHLVDRHEILRTAFINLDGNPRQKVYIPCDIDFSLKKVVVEEGSDSTFSETEKLIKQDLDEPFELTKPSMFRAYLITSGVESYILLSLHHSICDGWSINVLLQELVTIYDAYSSGVKIELPELDIQYKEFSAWQESQLDRDYMALQKKFWMENLKSAPQPLKINVGNSRPKERTYNGDFHQFSLGTNVSDALSDSLVEQNATLFMWLLSVLNVLCFKYSSERDITIGAPVSGRQHIELTNQIGCYVNTLALRTKFDAEDTFSDLLENVKKVAMKSYENQDYPFEKIIGDLNIIRDPSSSPLFNIMLVLQNTVECGDIQSDKLKLNEISVPLKTSKFDLCFHFKQTSSDIECQIEFNTDIFDKFQIIEMAKCLKIIAISVSQETKTKICEIPVFHDVDIVNEEQSKLFSLNIIDLFEEQVEQTPKEVAVYLENSKVTYAELSSYVNMLTDHLIHDKGVQPNDTVAVLLPRSIEMIISMLAIMKAGASYVPISIDHPKSRKVKLIESTDSGLVITKSNLSIAKSGVDILELTDLSDWNNKFRKIDSLSNRADGSSLAYVMFTSGTTGEPKAVMITHESICNTLTWRRDYYNLDQNDNSLQIPAYTFDSSVEDIFTPLISGASLVLLPQDKSTDLIYIGSQIEQKRVTTLLVTPSLYKLILDEIHYSLTSVRFIVIAGETFNENLVRDHYSRVEHIDLVNEYGPTENSVCSTVKRLDKESKITLGHPITNVGVDLFDEWLQPVPVGVKGEIYLRGAGLSKGYMNDPEQTESRFINHPSLPGTLMYRTGDFARQSENGELIFIGREDDQFKINGIRIESSEIEKALLSHPDVSQCVLKLMKGESSIDYLLAYITAKAPISTSTLRKYLAEILPNIMVPKDFVFLDKLPLTATGKVDKASLPKHSLTIENKVINRPKSRTELELAKIWCEILEKDEVYASDDFFEVGGDSLKAVELLAKIQKKFHVIISLRQIFSNERLSELANLLDKSEKDALEDIGVLSGRREYDLSPNQMRFWILEQYQSEQVSHNITGTIHFSDLELNAFKSAYIALIERHESLRTIFPQVDGRALQRVVPIVSTHTELEVTYLKGGGDHAEELQKLIIEAEVTPFSLEKGPLIRGRILVSDQIGSIFIYTVHHIVADGWSITNMINDLEELYSCFENGNGKTVNDLQIQYIDYTSWLKGKMTGDRLTEHKNFWLKTLNDVNTTLDLKYDKPRPRIKTFNGDSLNFSLSKELSDDLNRICREQGATLFMVLLSLVNILISKRTGQNDIILGTESAGREHPQLKSQIGLYLNLIALRNKVYAGEVFTNFLDEVKRSTLDALEYQHYPVENIVDDLGLKRDPSRLALFDVTVLLQNFDSKLGFGDFSESHSMNKTSKFDLTFEFIEDTNGISGSLEYNTDLFEYQTIELIKQNFLILSSLVAENPMVSIETLMKSLQEAGSVSDDDDFLRDMYALESFEL
ncbi:amino acid adenylation domain-containing protein [Vibrio caribbeanicus]|uniref:amino acid adenylation domain-containing protein n=1 Tax=Vibrio caribbeanicus TaxID=701175 RepID=UPI0002EA9865|nr:non-ribosomal peptide synthetase [Vibrio caribbeanicus]